MRAVTFQAPGEVRVEEVAEPRLEHPDEAIVAIEASGVCGSDLHIYHGRVPVEAGTVIGHEYVGTVLAVGDGVTRVAVGDRVLGCFHVACGSCTACLRGDYHRCERGRTFGHGSTLGSLPGTQAEQALVPFADVVLRKVPAGMSAETALFAGDVMGTGYHAVAHAGMKAGDTVAVLGLGPVGLCAVQAAVAGGAAHVFAVDSVEGRLDLAARFGATPVHLTEGDAKAEVRGASGGRGADVVVEAVGAPAAVEAAISLARNAGTVSGIGVQVGRAELNLGLAWLKGLDLRLGLANVIAHVDRVLALLDAGKLDPTPLVTHHMKLDDAVEAYDLYDRREALKIILTP
ncbi:MAG TPA: alcohol dehydrogenase catalytic domain-containing protein [Solirubrobacterales bacterium]|nr:alcohol dehydrogenase catalytic domain-containing protein [Solirubrobacterales bacterium]